MTETRTGAVRVDSSQETTTSHPVSAVRVDPDLVTRATPASRVSQGGSGDGQSLGQLVSSATKDLSELVRMEVALAKAELTSDVKAAGVGAGMLAAAGALAAVMGLMLTVAIAEALTALGVPRWLSYLLVALLYGLIAAVLALMGRKKLKAVKPPARTIATVKDDIAWAKHPTTAPTPTRTP